MAESVGDNSLSHNDQSDRNNVPSIANSGSVGVVDINNQPMITNTNLNVMNRPVLTQDGSYFNLNNSWANVSMSNWVEQNNIDNWAQRAMLHNTYQASRSMLSYGMNNMVPYVPNLLYGQSLR